MILDKVVEYFGVVGTPYNGPTYILPNGYFLDLFNYENHSDVEKWLIKNNLSDNKYIKTGN